MSEFAPFKKRLFKYRSLAGKNRDYTSRIIADRHIYYSAPEQFNDPFDCRVSVCMEGTLVPRSAERRAYAEKWFWEATILRAGQNEAFSGQLHSVLMSPSG